MRENRSNPKFALVEPIAPKIFGTLSSPRELCTFAEFGPDWLWLRVIPERLLLSDYSLCGIIEYSENVVMQ